MPVQAAVSPPPSRTADKKNVVAGERSSSASPFTWRHDLLPPRDRTLSIKLSDLIETGALDQPTESETLLALGEALDCSADERVLNHSNVYWLTGVIQKKLQVVRFYVAGSYGRRSSLGTPQIDLVAFLKYNAVTPYTKLQDELLPQLHAFLKDAVGGFAEVQVNPLVKAAQPRVRPGGPLSLDSITQYPKPPQVPTPPFSADDYISMMVGGAHFRIFLAPALADDGERQRQAAYKLMYTAFVNGGLSKLRGWHAALMERPSEEIAKAPHEIHVFLRLCQLWTRCHRIDTLDPYAVEVLAFLIAKAALAGGGLGGAGADAEKLLRKRGRADVGGAAGGSSLVSTSSSSSVTTTTTGESLRGSGGVFDLKTSFRHFLTFCTDLSAVNPLNRIEPPAGYVSPWPASESPLLTDGFNPYNNLFSSLTLPYEQSLREAATQSLQVLQKEPPCTLKDLFMVPSKASTEGATRKGKRNIFFWVLSGVALAMLAAFLCILFGIGSKAPNPLLDMFVQKWSHMVDYDYPKTAAEVLALMQSRGSRAVSQLAVWIRSLLLLARHLWTKILATPSPSPPHTIEVQAPILDA